MDWSLWLEIWDRHSRSERFARRMRSAISVAREGAQAGQLFCAMSGGKDSIALAAVLAEAGIACRMAHCHTDLNTPGMLECAETTATALGYEIDIVEPDIEGSVWDLLRSIPQGGSVLSPKHFSALMKKIASGNMLVAYQYALHYDGAYSGMRAEESRGRLMNRKIRGPTYRLVTDGAWMCCPIVDWSARDVFAAAVARGLPICDHYRLMHERFEIDPESPASRVDCLLTSDEIVARGSLAHAKALYPAIWRQLVSCRPELAREA